MNIKLMIFAVLIFVLATPSCTWDGLWNQNKKIVNPKDFGVTQEIGQIDDALDQTKTTVEKGTAIIKDSTDTIREEAGSIESASTVEDTRPHVAAIRTEADQIDNAANEIAALSPVIDNARQSVDRVESKAKTLQESAADNLAARTKAEEERDKALSDANEATRKMVRWVIILCIIGFGSSIALIFFVSPKVGIPGAVSCILTLVLAVSVEKYFEYIAWGGLGLIILVGIYGIYYFFVTKRALTETVHTTEVVKNQLPEEKKEEIFGKAEKPGVTKTIQSKSTEKIVRDVRKSMAKEWEPTIKKNPEI